MTIEEFKKKYYLQKGTSYINGSTVLTTALIDRESGKLILKTKKDEIDKNDKTYLEQHPQLAMENRVCNIFNGHLDMWVKELTITGVNEGNKESLYTIADKKNETMTIDELKTKYYFKFNKNDVGFERYYSTEMYNIANQLLDSEKEKITHQEGKKLISNSTVVEYSWFKIDDQFKRSQMDRLLLRLDVKGFRPLDYEKNPDLSELYK